MFDFDKNDPRRKPLKKIYSQLIPSKHYEDPKKYDELAEIAQEKELQKELKEKGLLFKQVAPNKFIYPPKATSKPNYVIVKDFLDALKTQHKYLLKDYKVNKQEDIITLIFEDDVYSETGRYLGKEEYLITFNVYVINNILKINTDEPFLIDIKVMKKTSDYEPLTEEELYSNFVYYFEGVIKKRLYMEVGITSY